MTILNICMLMVFIYIVHMFSFATLSQWGPQRLCNNPKDIKSKSTFLYTRFQLSVSWAIQLWGLWRLFWCSWVFVSCYGKRAEFLLHFKYILTWLLQLGHVIKCYIIGSEICISLQNLHMILWELAVRITRLIKIIFVYELHM